ncbi:Clavaminate synthase-like protein [Trichoderma citrinoviride]|uniref:Clavaminate synthase-like protein n=1 Tax=Trichoderma citrinoviride TaxID=58853 RepID=A0A2T4B9Y0_9HYPO|nr:Clavaminate synthase-like protein [Trichoderma citrinoviride]PTB66088.1 Clavaminate synthase-like protein [Trichoderma citrinoviride]
MFQQLDFSVFHSDNAAEREGLCSQLVSNLKQFGFARLVNVGIPLGDIDRAFEISRVFFQLPLSEKLKSPHPPTANPHRGYSAFGIENVSAISNHGTCIARPLLKDMKESYDIGSQEDALYDNIWPPPGVHDAFQPAFTSFFSTCYRAQLSILKAISIGLALPEQTLSQLHTEQANELRLTHYPTVPRGDFSHSTRIAAHTDFGTITLLFQDDVGGLQVELPSGSGKFVDIASGGRYECILNVGDCLHLWTGLRSARHRVHLPASGNAGKTADSEDDVVDERYSIAYFAKPNRSASLRPLLQDAGARAEGVSYMTAGEFQQMRISGTY